MCGLIHTCYICRCRTEDYRLLKSNDGSKVRAFCMDCVTWALNNLDRIEAINE